MKVLELLADDLKNFISDYKNSKYQDGWVIEPKLGNLSFLTKPGNITLHCKRESGNGKILVSAGDYSENFTVASKISQIVRFEIKEETKVTISRPDDSLGEVVIFGIEIEAEEIKDIALIKNWGILVSKCGKYQGIQQVGERLFVQEKGFLENGDAVREIETTPPGIALRNNGRIVFAMNGEVTNLVLDPTYSPPHPENPLYRHRMGPTPYFENSKVYTNKNVTYTPPAPLQSKIDREIVMVYDSQNSHGLRSFRATNTKLVKHIISNGLDYLLSKRGGNCYLPVSGLIPNTDYVVVITAKKYSGNGRMYFGLSNSSNPVLMTSVLIDDTFNDKYLILNSGPEPAPGEAWKLNISMPDDCTGETLLSRARIVNGISIEHVRSKIEKKNHSPYQIAKDLATININYGSKILEPINDRVTLSAKKFARQVCSFNVQNKNFEIKGNILSTTFSGLSWINKISSFYPNLSIFKVKDNLSPSDVVSIGATGNIVPSKSIWLEPFKTLTEDDLAALNQCDNIFTPSLSNHQYLQTYLPKKNITQAFKPLPYISEERVDFFANQDYILVFNRNYNATKRILAAWKEGMPKIALVGARGGYPSFVLPINEYVSYEKLLFILLNSKCIIDIPDNNDYDSGMLHLAHAAGVPIISSNWFAFRNTNCEFLLLKDWEDDTPVPIVNSIRQAFDKVMMDEHPRKSLENYNDHLFKFAGQFFSA